MHISSPRRLHLLALPLFLAVSAVLGGEAVVSTMHNPNAVMEARGFYLAPAPDLSGEKIPGDHAPVMAMEIIRPKGEAITIGRLYTSCSCTRLEAPDRTFESGERAILKFRNVLLTPPQGHTYAMYVQLTSPIRTTLRYDTFLQSDEFKPKPEVVAPPGSVKVTSEPEVGEINVGGQKMVLITPKADQIVEEKAAEKPEGAPGEKKDVEKKGEEKAVEKVEPAGEKAEASGEPKAAQPGAAPAEEKAPEKAAPPAEKKENLPLPAEEKPTKKVDDSAAGNPAGQDAAVNGDNSGDTVVDPAEDSLDSLTEDNIESLTDPEDVDVK